MKRFIIYILIILFSIEIIYANAHIKQHHNIQKKLFYYTLKSAKAGNYIAQYELANIYRDGISVAVDFKKAFHLYHLSALKGYPPAQYQLGMAFRHGLGVRANQELARYWIRKSAKNNYISAQEVFKIYYSKKRPIVQYQFALNNRY